MITPEQIAELRRLLAATSGRKGPHALDISFVAKVADHLPGILDDLDALRRENAELREEGDAARSALLQQAEELGRRIADLEAVLFQNPVMEDILWGEQPDSESITISLKLGKWRRLRAARLVAKPAPETGEDACG